MKDAYSMNHQEETMDDINTVFESAQAGSAFIAVSLFFVAAYAIGLAAHPWIRSYRARRRLASQLRSAASRVS
jgi:hypothetical protein